MKKTYYISGLPRAGSTILANILNQNPRFAVSKSTSGLSEVLFSIRNQYDQLIEHKAEIGGVNYNRLKNILNSVSESYHNTDKSIIIDKGRGWISLIEMVEFMGDESPKIIVPVRDISEIMASMEKLWRNSTGQSQWVFEKQDYVKSQTVEGRCDIWADESQSVGIAYNRIKDAITRGHREKLHFVEFDSLTGNPKTEMEKIYSFFGEENYNHDFNNVETYSMEDDIGTHRIPNLHATRKEVRPVDKVAKDIIGKELVKKYYGSEFWRGLD